MQHQNKAIFLDRDGLLNDNSIAYYIYRKEDFKLNPGVIDCLKLFYDKNYLLILVTNQGGVAKKEYNCSDVEILNEHLKNILKTNDIEITEIYYCPHHSSVSKCLCRKPGSLLFEKAIAKYHIDNKLSLMIGDSDRDIIAAENAGIKGIKVPSNTNLYKTLRQSEISHLLD
jgi:D-glycero-D-manno-heptose 1,7-bisphosphate phosphatase